MRVSTGALDRLEVVAEPSSSDGTNVLQAVKGALKAAQDAVEGQQVR